MTEEMKQLAAIVGEYRARELVREAVGRGKDAFDVVDWKWRRKIYGPKLTAQSEAFPPPPPPPPPDRFSYIDVGDDAFDIDDPWRR